MEEKKMTNGEENAPAVPQLSATDSLGVAQYIVKVLDARKGHNIKLLHVEEQTTIADYFVICTGHSRTQVNALADEVEFKLEEAGLNPLRKEGGASGVWTLLDYGSVIVHVFGREGREFYNLEKLFDAGTEMDISALLTEN